MANIWRGVFPPSPPRYLAPNTTYSVSTGTFITATDPAGIRGALRYVAGWVPSSGSIIQLSVPEGRYIYTTPIIVTQSNARHIRITGTTIAMAGMNLAAATPNAKPILSVTNIGIGAAAAEQDIVLNWTGGTTTGTQAGNYILILGDQTDVSGAGRVRDLCGVHRITARDTVAKTLTLKSRSRKDLDNTLGGADVQYHSFRVMRTIIEANFAWSAAHQGLFDVSSGIYFDGLVLAGGRTELGVPSSGAFTTAGTRDTFGFICRAGGLVRCGAIFAIADFGDSAYENLGGDVDFGEGRFTASNCYNNGVYSQYGGRNNIPNGAITGCHLAIACESYSGTQAPDKAFVGNDTAVQAQDGAVVNLLHQCHLSSNGVVFRVDGGHINAEGSETSGLNNTTITDFDNGGYLAWTNGGVDYVQVEP